MPYSFSYVSYRTTKKRLWGQLKPFGRREFSKYINQIIADNRNIDIAEANQMKYLRSNEVIVLLAQIGEPMGPFGKEVVFDSSRLTRNELSKKIPFLSSLVLKSKIVKIIMENRDIDRDRARFAKTLHSNEVRKFLEEIGENVMVNLT